MYKSSSKIKVIGHGSRSSGEKYSFFRLWMRPTMHILNRQRAAPNVHTTLNLTQFIGGLSTFLSTYDYCLSSALCVAVAECKILSRYFNFNKIKIGS